MIILPKISGIKTGCELARKGVKDAVNEENGIINETKRLFSDIKEVTEQGKVYTKGVSDAETQSRLESISDGIASYAKANKLNIIFHTPIKNEAGYSEAEKTLGVSAYSSGLFNVYNSMAFINGDVNKITKYKGEKLEADDTFNRRVYRTVEQLTKEINKERKADYDKSFIGATKNGIKEDFNKIVEKTKSGIKKYVDKKIKFLKEEFGTAD